MSSGRTRTERDIRFQKRLATGFLVAGAIGVIAGVVVFADARRFYASAIRVPGKVVQLEERKSDKETTFFAVFAFTDSVGGSHIVRSSFGYTRNWWNPVRQYEVGDAVEVLYTAQDLESARLNDFFSLWGWTLLIGGGGGLGLLAGIVLWHGALTWRR